MEAVGECRQESARVESRQPAASRGCMRFSHGGVGCCRRQDRGEAAEASGHQL